jgi:hypothetical protein
MVSPDMEDVAERAASTAAFITGPILSGVYVGLRCSLRTIRNGFAVVEIGGLYRLILTWTPPCAG